MHLLDKVAASSIPEAKLCLDRTLSGKSDLLVNVLELQTAGGAAVQVRVWSTGSAEVCGPRTVAPRPSQNRLTVGSADMHRPDVT